MEQVIKFRALKDDMSNCIFMYGQLVYDAIGQPRITEIDSSGKGLTFHTCLKGTEGQFTGLTDKQGKEIYVGDKFCDFHNKERFGVVKFGEYDSTQSTDGLIIYGGRVGFYVDFNSDFMRKDLGFWSRHSEIIGNIHQNSK